MLAKGVLGSHWLLLLYLTKKRHIQTQATQDKAWQGMARQGQARQDEAAPRQEGVPWFWKILYFQQDPKPSKFNCALFFFFNIAIKYMVPLEQQ